MKVAPSMVFSLEPVEKSMPETETEKLRSLLAEVRRWMIHGDRGAMFLHDLQARIDAALAEPVVEWDIKTALNHHARCAIYDDGHCTCGFRARRETLERSPLAVGEGTWSVFAQKVVAERDEARAAVKRAKAEATAWKESAEAAERFRKSAIAEAEVEVEVLKALLNDAREGLDTLAVPGSEHNLKWLQDVRARMDAARAKGFTEGHAAGRQAAYDGEVTNADLQRAYRRGAEAMREAAALEVECNDAECRCDGDRHAEWIRALPIPEDRP